MSLGFFRNQLDAQQYEVVVRMLIGRTEQTFLWISLVVRQLKAAAVLTLGEIKAIVDRSPSELDKLHDTIVTDIMGRDGDIPKKVLVWAVYWKRPLTLAELEEAISVQHDSQSIESTSEYRLPLGKNKNYLAGAIGVIVNISNDNKVHLTHQSVKDFLMKSSHLTSAEFCRGLRPNLYLAQICMLFICFPDSESDSNHEGRTGFLRYAAWNWHRHIENDLDGMSAGSLDELIARVAEPRSLALRRWAKVTGQLASLEDAKEIWEIAMGASITWLGEFKSMAFKGQICAVRVVDAAKHGVSGYQPFLTLVQRADVEFTHDAVYELVRHFDQSMLFSYEASHGPLLRTQALYVAAAGNRLHALAMLRFLIQVSKGELRPPNVVVDKSLARQLIQPGDGVTEGPDYNRDGSALSDLVQFLAQSDKVEFTGEGWAELLLCATEIKHAVITLALETRQDCCSADVVLTIAERYRKDGYPKYRQFTAWQPNISNATAMRLLSQYQHLGNVVHDDVAMWAATQLGRDDFADFLEKASPQPFVIEKLLKAAAKCCDGEIVLWLVEIRGDEIRTTEQLICVLARLTGENQNSNIDVDVDTKRWCRSGGPLGLWLLLILGIGTEIVVSDKILEEAKRGQSSAVVGLLRRLRQEGTSIGLQHVIELLDPPLGFPKRLRLWHIASVFQKYSCHSRLPDEFLIRAALHKEVELMALIFEHWPDALHVTTELLKAVVSVADCRFLDRSFWAKFETGIEYNVTLDAILENDYYISPERAIELMELLLRMRRRNVEAAVCEDVCLMAASCGNLDMVQFLCETEHLVLMNNEWAGIAELRKFVHFENRQNLERIKALLKKTPPDTADYWGVSPLAIAVRERNVKTVRMLLASGRVDVNRAGRKGQTVIFLVVQPGLGRIDEYPGQMSSTCADENRRTLIARILIRAGARLDVVDCEGCGPVAWAQRYQDKLMANLLEQAATRKGQELDYEELPRLEEDDVYEEDWA